MATAFFLFLLWFSLQECYGLIRLKAFLKGSSGSARGTMIPFPASDSLASCSLQCLKDSLCTAVLFNVNEVSHMRCKLISSNSSVSLDLNALSGYEYFILSPETLMEYNYIGGIAKPIGWRSGFPKLYFPLDSDQSGTYFGSSVNANFSTLGKLGQAIYIKNGDGLPPAYHNLGNNFCSSQYCFPEPGSCMNGATFAFWMKIPGQPTSYTGYPTTAHKKGPGFVVFWDLYWNKLVFVVRRDTDTREDRISIAANDMNTDYGFNTWIHYVITYRLVAWE